MKTSVLTRDLYIVDDDVSIDLTKMNVIGNSFVLTDRSDRCVRIVQNGYRVVVGEFAREIRSHRPDVPMLTFDELYSGATEMADVS